MKEILSKYKIVLISLSIICISILLMVTGFLYIKKQPRYTLYQVKKSIDIHDIDRFNIYVDVDHFIEKLTDDFIEISQDDNTNIFAELMSGMFKDMIRTSVKKYVNNLIESPNNIDSKDKLSKILSGHDITIKDIKHIKKEGKLAFVAYNAYHNKYEGDIVIEFKLKYNENKGHYIIYEFNNLQEYMKQLNKLKVDKLTTINVPIQEQINSNVVLGDISLFRSKNYLTTTLSVELPIKNIGQRVVKGVDISLEIYDNTLPLKAFEINIEDLNLLPGNIITKTMYKDLYEFSEQDNILINGDISTQRYLVSINGIKFSDGSYVKIKTSLDEE